MHLLQEPQASKNRKYTITTEVLKHRQFLGRCTSHMLLMRPKSRVGFPVQMHNLAQYTTKSKRLSMWAGFPNYSLEGKGINIVINWLTRNSHLR